jgi:hypothetical protein
MTPDEVVCECGHVRDEHRRVGGSDCLVDNCKCCNFDPAPQEDES